MFAILKLKFHFRRITEIRKAEEHIYEIVLERLRCRGLCLSKHPDRSMFEFKGLQAAASMKLQRRCMK
jgi:hypothetical protein